MTFRRAVGGLGVLVFGALLLAALQQALQARVGVREVRTNEERSFRDLEHNTYAKAALTNDSHAELNVDAASPGPRDAGILEAVTKPGSLKWLEEVHVGIAGNGAADSGDEENVVVQDVLGSEDEGATIATLWRRELVDPDWTAETHDYLAAAVANAQLPPDRLQAVDCRTTLCRVELRLPDIADAAALRRHSDPDAEIRVYPVRGRPGTFSIFIARREE